MKTSYISCLPCWMSRGGGWGRLMHWARGTLMRCLISYKQDIRHQAHSIGTRDTVRYQRVKMATVRRALCGESLLGIIVFWSKNPTRCTFYRFQRGGSRRTVVTCSDSVSSAFSLTRVYRCLSYALGVLCCVCNSLQHTVEFNWSARV